MLVLTSIAPWLPRIYQTNSKPSCWGGFFNKTCGLADVPLPQSLLRLTLGQCFPLERHPLFWPPYLEELSIKRPFLNVPVDVILPETLRKLDCDGDILEV